MRKRILAVIIAASAAMAVPAPATAGGGNANAAWWFLGGALFDRFVIGGQRVYSHPLPPARVGIVHCPVGTVHYDLSTNICYTQTFVQPLVAAVSSPQPRTVQGPGRMSVQTTLGECLPGQTEVRGTPQNSTCEHIGNTLRCRNICQ